MKDQPATEKSGLEADKANLMEGSGRITDAQVSPNSQAEQPTQDEPVISRKLTADEQMALYEKALKEDDWGHQPC